MYSLPKNVYRERKDFSKIRTTVEIPNLIEIQRKSYERFLQMNRLPSEREDQGLQSVFKSVFPISDFRENSSLEFIEYSIGNWECKCGKLQGLHHLRKPCQTCGHTLVADPYGDKDVLCPKCGTPNQARGDVCDICGHTVALKLKYDVDECQERGMTYAVPLKVTIRLVVWNKDPETGVKTIRDIKEQEVYFGDIPLMTDNGTFIINGTERVIVSQLHRSPGAFFHSEDKTLYVAQIIPYRGSWVEFEYDVEEPALRAHRSQAQVPGDGVPARARPARRRRDHPRVPLGRSHQPQGQHAAAGRSATASSASAPSARSRRATSRSARAARSPRRTSTRCARPAIEDDRGHRRGARGRLHRVGHRRSGDRRGAARGQRGADAARHLDGAGEERRARSTSSSPSATKSARFCRRR